jgi:hypothetical protein
MVQGLFAGFLDNPFSRTHPAAACLRARAQRAALDYLDMARARRRISALLSGFEPDLFLSLLKSKLGPGAGPQAEWWWSGI